LNIAIVNTFDVQGGAARAVYRLHKGLRQIGEECRMVVRFKKSVDDAVFAIDVKNDDNNVDETFLLNAVQESYINSHRTDISNTIFTLPYPGYDLSKLSYIQKADIINLHWVAYYQSPVTLQKLFALGKPVVWTLHDQWAFTGGCHYSAGCKKYTLDCSACPQLADDPFDLSAAMLRDKVELFQNANLTVVTPSRWLADCVKESKLFRKVRVEVIPNSLETDVFSPLSKSEAKESLGISTDTVTLLFGAEAGDEKRKGFRELVDALSYCKADVRFQRMVDEGRVKIICFGQPGKKLESLAVPAVSLGYLNSDDQIRTAYSAADVFLLPSLEDNLPNTMLESLACGTPIIAFDVGGIPDVVIDNATGRLAPVGNTEEMGGAILSLIFDPDQRGEMGRRGRDTMVKDYSLSIQAERYLRVYEDLLHHSSVSDAVAEGGEHD
jgi:glycosyltransferase involved in cell wall biosynthesis